MLRPPTHLIALVATIIVCCVIPEIDAQEQTIPRTELGETLCYAAVGADRKTEVDLLEVCQDAAPGIMSGGSFFDGAARLCRWFGRSAERRLACYRTLNRGHSHKNLKRGFYDCLDEAGESKPDMAVRCIERALHDVQTEMTRTVNSPVAETLCKKAVSTAKERTRCLEQIDEQLATSTVAELGLSICAGASDSSRANNCYAYTFRQYQSSRLMNEKLKDCRRAHERGSPDLGSCLKRELEAVLAAHRERKKEREEQIEETLRLTDTQYER